MQSDMETPVQYLKGVGGKRAELFARLGLHTAGDLIAFYPRCYEDWSKTVRINEAPVDQPCCVRAHLISHPQEHRIRRGLSLYKFTVSDGESGLHITLFNQKYVAAKLELGREYLFFGTVACSYHQVEMASPLIEPVGTGLRIRPIYRQTYGLSSKVIEQAVRSALEKAGGALSDDCLPEELRRRYGLCPREQALRQIHFPDSQQLLDEARRRLVFEELFLLQIGLLRLKGRGRLATGATVTRDDTAAYERLLPFTLTGAQKRAIADCMGDIRKPYPMSRLIQGDVGSGKTAVAAGVAYTMAKAGFQTAMMAPTEILAAQHQRTLSVLLAGSGLTVGLLVGSQSAAQKRETLAALEDGSLSLVVGTHALLSEQVRFAALGLVITDEQHRFGVSQRAALAAKGCNPHLLVMSATPIPRTLALMIYGDLDISVLDELPPGRQPIATYAIGTDKRERAYGYIKKHLDQGRQAYIVCPLVEEDEESDGGLVSATAYIRQLSDGAFRGYRLGLLHGRMKGAEKEAVMASFAAGELDLLVATTVIEVGVDVPNAVMMVIENAERFGLAQLHQLRGRVGRGEYASTCILISDAHGEEARMRLRAMCATNDGFRIADEDLRLRGPGDFFGNRQHGLPQLALADLKGDLSLLQDAQREAVALHERDPQLAEPAHTLLRERIACLFAAVGEQGLN